MPLLCVHVIPAGTARFEGALAAAVAPLSRLLDVIDAWPAEAHRLTELTAAWEAQRIVAFCGEALHALHERLLEQRRDQAKTK